VATSSAYLQNLPLILHTGSASSLLRVYKLNSTDTEKNACVFLTASLNFGFYNLHLWLL